MLKISTTRFTFMLAVASVAGSSASPAEPPTVPAFSKRRRSASPFRFPAHDASGRALRLADYRGKIVVLAFWPTWCHGCKEEIPGSRSLNGNTVPGDSQWQAFRWATPGAAVKAFLAAAHLAYRILLGDPPTAKKYAISAMQDTFLDRSGRIAAACLHGA